MPDRDVACIIPVKDRRELILEALESVVCQSRRVDEIVVVDDGSSDGTPEVVERHFPFVRLIRANGLGPGRARNLGVSAVRTAIVMFLDSDDLWTKDHVAALSEPILENGGCAFGIASNEGPGITRPFHIPGDEFEPARPVAENLFRWCCMVPSAFAVERSVFIASGGFPAMGLGEDWIFFAGLSLTHRFHFVSKVVTRRRIHRRNICWRNFSVDSARRVVSKLKQMAQTSGLEEAAEHFTRVSNLMDREGHKWKSVQDWYTSLKRHRLI